MSTFRWARRGSRSSSSDLPSSLLCSVLRFGSANSVAVGKWESRTLCGFSTAVVRRLHLPLGIV